MKKITRTATTLAVGLGLAGFLALGATLPAHADGTAVTATVTAGTLTGGATSFGDFSSPILLLSGTLTTNTTWTIGSITDSTGSGAGWQDTLTLPQFKAWDSTLNAGSGGYAVGGHVIPTSSFEATNLLAVTESTGTGSNIDTITPLPISTPLDTGLPVKLLDAALDGGMGTYAVTAPLQVKLTLENATAYAAVYKSDATLTLSTAP